MHLRSKENGAVAASTSGMHASFFFWHFRPKIWYLFFIPFPHISIAGSAACNCLCSPVILPAAQPTTDEQLKVARLTLEDTQSYSGLSSFLFGLADHSHTLRQP